MKTHEIIAGLRKLSEQGSQYRRTVCRLAADRLEEQNSKGGEIDPFNRWVPVTERLPSEEGLVLVIVSGQFRNMTFDNAYELADYCPEGWILEAWPEWESPDVTHWMPLPALPKEEV